MKISIISDENVLPDKTLASNEVSAVQEIESLSDLSEIGLEFHITPATFHNIEYKQEWIKTDWHKQFIGQTGYWKQLPNFEQIQFLCFDFDKGDITSQQIHNRLKHINHLILGSKNHMKDKGDGKGIVERFHVFIPLDESITDKDFYKFCCKKLASALGWKSDNNVMEASRYFYRHGSQLFITEDKSNFSLDTYKRMFLENDLPKRTIQYDNNVPTLEKFKRTKYFKIMKNGELQSDGNRYDLSNRIIGCMKLLGVDSSDALNLFDEYSSYGKSFTRKSVERRMMEL